MTAAFFTLHCELPREGPGDRASLDWALAQVNLPEDARIVDAGCGPGADIEGLLAHAPRGRVMAIDAHAPFAEAVAVRYADDPRVTAVAGDMRALEGPLDLIWSAGAVYNTGVTETLAGWKDTLVPGGHVIFSEIVWLTDQPPEKLRAYWAQYPAMQDRAGLWRAVAAAGFRVKAETILSDAAWEAYFTPIEARIAALSAAGTDTALDEVIAEQETEIALWRAHRDVFGYALLVVRPE